MRMLKITTMDDLVKNSMNVLEPSLVDATRNDHEDDMKFHFHVTVKLSPYLIHISYCIIIYVKMSIFGESVGPT
jgi:hypothetical protein